MTKRRKVIQTWNRCLVPGRCHLSLPLYYPLLTQPGPVWMCSPWEPTGKLVQWSQMKPHLKRLLVRRKTRYWSQIYFFFFNLRVLIKSGRIDKTVWHRQVPGAATCNGVVGTLRPPDSSSCVARNKGLSYIPRPESNLKKDTLWKKLCVYDPISPKTACASGAPPCDASCPRSECEEELVCGMSSEGPNLKRGTPATWGELIKKKRKIMHSDW